MIALPEWESDFVRRSRRHTRKADAYAVVRFLMVFAAPWGLALTSFWGIGGADHAFRMIAIFFAVVVMLFGGEQIGRGVWRRQKRRAISALFYTVPELALLCALCIYWWLLFPGHIALAIAAWWAFGVFLGLSRYAWRRWALAEAVLQTRDYRLFGRRVGRSVKRAKHDKASLYGLAQKSAFHPGTVMVLRCDEPEVYVSSDARSRLEADQLRAIIAHELGHSWSQHHVGREVGEWVRRMFLVPLLGWVASILLAAAPVRTVPVLVSVFLTVLMLVWKFNAWMSNLLNRPRELAADLYAVEMTRTPEAFVEGMRRLVESEPYNVFPNLFDTLGFRSHPCIVKRLEHVAAAVNAAAEEPAVRKLPGKTNR